MVQERDDVKGIVKSYSEFTVILQKIPEYKKESAQNKNVSEPILMLR